MVIARQDVGSLGSVQRKSASRQTVSSAYRVGVDASPSFASELMSGAGTIASAAANYMKQQTEEDRLKQQQLALQGLDPTEDATFGGKRAHMLVGAQNKVMENTARLKAEAATFTGNDSEWADKVVQSRNEAQQTILADYPELQGDKNTMTALTNMYMEQSPAIAGSRIEGKLVQEQTQRINDFSDRIDLSTEGLTGEDLQKAVGTLTEEGVLLNLSVPEMENIFKDRAMNAARTGDTNLIEATKHLKNANGRSLYERDGKLQQANISGKRIWAANHQEVIATMKSDLTGEFNNQGLSAEEFRRKAGEQNDETGNAAWTNVQINKAISDKAKATASNAQTQKLAIDILDGNLAGVGDYTKKEKKAIAETLLSNSESQIDALILAGKIPEEQRDAAISEAKTSVRVKLAGAGIVDKQLQDQISNLQNITPDHFKGMEEFPPEVTAIMNTMQSMPVDMRNNIVPAKEAAFIHNINLAQQMGRNPAQAIEFAQAASRNTSMSSSQLGDVADKAKSVANDVADGSWMPFDSMPDYAKSRIQDEASQIITTMRQAGYSIEDAEAQARGYLSANYSMIGDVLVRGKRNSIAAKMQVNDADLELQMQGYLAMNSQELLDNAGPDTNLEDLYFDIDTERGIARVRHGSAGMLVSNPISLDELGESKYPEYLQQIELDEQVELARDLERRKGRVFTPSAEPYKYGAQVAPPTKSVEPVVLEAEPEKVVPAPLVPKEPIGEVRNWNTFETDLQGAENGSKLGFNYDSGAFQPYDSDIGTEGNDTVAYGHYITRQERENGFIMIGENPVKFRAGDSEMTDSYAKQLLKQDIAEAKESLAPQLKDFEKMNGGVQRAFVDTAFNAGGNFLSKAPSAKAYFDKGDYASGFTEMLDYKNEGGKRVGGLLKRRALALNMIPNSPQATEYRVEEDGSMAVKLKDITKLSKKLQGRVKDGWFIVAKARKNSLHPDTKVGTFKL